MDTGEVVGICREALDKAHRVLDSLRDGGISEVRGEHVTDISTKGDLAVSRALTGFFRERGIPAVLFSEESGRIELVKKPEYAIAIDDIDGSDNYHRGRGLLPYCTVVCIFDSPKPRFRDALAAGVIEHNSGRIWHAVRDKGCFLNGRRVKTSGRKVLDRRTSVIIDHYMCKEYISGLLDLYPLSWVKDFGSTALHLAGVGSGMFDAFLAPPMHQAHEIGAGYLLIKEAGGFLSSWRGKPLDRERYDFFGRYSIVAASTQELGRALLSRIRKP